MHGSPTLRPQGTERREVRITKPTAITAAAAMLAAGSIVALPAVATAAPSTSSAIVINEIYPGGGNTGAVYTHDFVELRNTSAAAVDVTGWSVQYSSAAGTNWSGVIPLTGTIDAGGYYLVQGASGGAVGAALPTPNASGTVNMGANGNIALANQATALTCAGIACATADAVVDLFGRGDARLGATQPAAVTNATSWSRDAASTNTLTNSADFTVGTPTPTAGEIAPPVDPELTAISAIQGTGAASPLVGQAVIVRGVVTAAYPVGGLFGYMIQTPGTGGTLPEGHAASEGLYIRVSSGAVDKAVGDHIEVTGTVAEFSGLTQVETTADAVTVLTEAAAPVTPLAIAWPTTDAAREAIESMLILPTDDFVVSNTYSTNQYGELGLATGGMPLIQPTDIARPGSPEYTAAVADNAARAVTLDDAATTNYTAAANQAFTPPYVSLTNPVRVGQSVTFVDPVVVDFRNNVWKLQPTVRVTGPDSVDSPVLLDNNRTATPDVAAIGDTGLSVASFNVLNYFTTLGADTPGCTSYKDRDGNGITVNSGCDPRGAWRAEDLARQQEKIVAAINTLDASVIGLMEIENSARLGETADEATATLVTALNAASEAGKWAFVASSDELPPLSQQDVITNAIIYQPAKATPMGAMRVLGDQSFAGAPFSNAREPLGQAFYPTEGGDPFFVAVNHLKSKGSGSGANADTGDGQGASNLDRVRQATAIVSWVEETLADYAAPIEAAYLVGDFNSYSMEDPMKVLYDAGYTNVNGAFGDREFSYSFSGLSGSLDHVVANEAGLARATGSDIWNINSPESIALEYSRYNSHGTLFHAPDAFRSSDHDPVVVGITAGTGPRFPDVPNDHPFYGEIEALAALGIIGGYTDGTFRPSAAVSRQAAAAFLYRDLVGGTAPACTEAPFTDVPTTHPFCGEIAAMADLGVINGYSDGTFKPAATVSRQAMAAFLYRSYGPDTAAAECTVAPFSDVSVSHTFCGEIAWLVESGITTGYPDGTFRPVGAVTRQAMAAFMYRAMQPAEITLLNINDFHGRIDPGTPLTRRMALTVEELRADAPGGSLFLSAGDNIGASLFASSMADDVPTLDVLNALELGTSAVGNHEFDRGFDALTNDVIPGSDFSYLGANVYHKGTTDPALDEYELLTVDGLTVGVIGVVTEETPALVSPGGIATLDFGDPIEAVNRVAAQLSDGNLANGEADVIVAEYHEGANVTTSYADAKAASPVFEAIATTTSADVDVIFMGHTHLKYAFDGEIPGSVATRPIVQTGAYGANVGRVVLSVDRSTGDVTAYTAANIPVSTLTGAELSTEMAAFPRAAAVESIVLAAIAEANVVGSQVLGTKTADITTAYAGGAFVDGTWTGGTRDNRAAASTMGTEVANALLATASPAGEVADIGIVNPGGLRADFLMSTGPDITLAQANAVLPFVNNVWFTTLTGAQFVKVLNQQWQRDAAGNVPSRAYLQLGLSDNVTYVADPTRPEGERIVSVTIDGAPIDLAASYRISSFSFLIQGGDNFREFASGTATVDTGLVDRDAWFAYIEGSTPLSPNFAKSGIDVTGLPADGVVARGETVSWTVSNINMTSLGSPENTSITAAIGDTELGTFPVTAGTATIAATIPGDTALDAQLLTITAPVSGTTVTIPVTVGPDVAQVTLLNINDFHGRIEAPRAQQFALTIEQERAAADVDGGSLLLSAGDNIGASLFASSVADDVPTLDMLNALELGTTAVGNHEFDRGFDRLSNEVAADSDFSHLGANVYHKGTSNPALEEYELLTVEGITVGVIGVVTQETPALVSPGGIATLDFGDPIAAVNRVAGQLSDGDPLNGEADVIVAEYHEGANVASSLADALAASPVFANIATTTSADVDVIFMGHTHLKYAWDGPIPGSTDTRPIVQTGSYGDNLGKVVLDVNRDSGEVLAYVASNVARSTLTAAPLTAAMAAFPRAVTVNQIVTDAIAAANVVGAQVLGAKTADITTAFSGGAFTAGVWAGGTRDDRAAASTMANAVSNALLATANPADGEVADIGIVNPGGLRADFLMSTGPDITLAQANAVLPFVNNVWFTTLTGAQFVKVLNQQWQRDAAGNVPSRAYLQLGLSDNVTYVADPTRPEGERIVSVTIDGAPIDLAASYRISSFSFLIQGGDNFREFASGTATVDTGLVDRDAWFAYIADSTPLSPNFAKSGIDVSGLPAGQTFSAAAPPVLTVSNINLTSLGSPENTSVTVTIGATDLGSFPVTNGSATVVIPAALVPEGAHTLTITAPVSGTTATIPVIVTP